MTGYTINNESLLLFRFIPHVIDVENIDQSQFYLLENYEQLKGRNVQQVFQEMKWEE